MTSDITHRYQLPYLMPAQAQKHVTVNEAIRMLDAVIAPRVLSQTVAAEPVTPVAGDAYILPASPTGTSWSSLNEHDLVVFQDEAWNSYTPKEGWRVYDGSSASFVVFDGSVWKPEEELVSELQNLVYLGVGISADASNPFSARLNAALWTALFTGDGGTGDLRYTLNKEASSNVLSLLMQSGWSGRVELGLIGDDDLSVKVSDDGSSWTEALRIDHTSGEVLFPAGGVREQITANRTYYVDTTLGSDSNDGLTSGAGAFATIQKAVDTVASLDLNVYVTTINVADGTYNEPLSLPRLTGGNPFSVKCEIIGNPVTPANVIVDSAGGNCVTTFGAPEDWKMEGFSFQNCNAVFRAKNGVLKIDNIVFASGSNFGFNIDANGLVEAVGSSMEVTGDLQRFATLSGGGALDMRNAGLTLSGTRNFSTAFMVVSGKSQSNWGGASVTGSGTGKRYQISELSFLRSGNGSVNFFPGDVAGTTTSGAVYT